jgi:uncharacterized protein Usg
MRSASAGYGLTTANILYRRPDHPWLLQSYVWQNYDLYPDFPELQCFLKFWQKSLEGVLHSVGRAVEAAVVRNPSACRNNRNPNDDAPNLGMG